MSAEEGWAGSPASAGDERGFEVPVGKSRKLSIANTICSSMSFRSWRSVAWYVASGRWRSRRAAGSAGAEFGELANGMLGSCKGHSIVLILDQLS